MSSDNIRDSSKTQLISIRDARINKMAKTARVSLKEIYIYIFKYKYNLMAKAITQQKCLH